MEVRIVTGKHEWGKCYFGLVGEDVLVPEFLLFLVQNQHLNGIIVPS